MRLRWWVLAFGLHALGGCDDDPAIAGVETGSPDAAPEIAPDMSPRDADRPLDGAVAMDAGRAADRGPMDSAADRAVDAAEVAVDAGEFDLGSMDGGPIDGSADAFGLDGAADSTPDTGGDALVDAALDADPDAEPDLAPDMPWAPAVHRVFMTAEAFSADFGGLAGADGACARAADLAGLDGTWRAILSDRRTAARDRLRIEGGIETTAGERVALDAADLWDGSIRAPIAVDARGERFVGRPDVWTSTDADGESDRESNSACSAWGADDRPLGAVEIGRGDLTDARWISLYRAGASAYGCGSQARLYCIDGQP